MYALFRETELGEERIRETNKGVSLRDAREPAGT